MDLTVRFSLLYRVIIFRQTITSCQHSAKFLWSLDRGKFRARENVRKLASRQVPRPSPSRLKILPDELKSVSYVILSSYQNLVYIFQLLMMTDPN